MSDTYNVHDYWETVQGIAEDAKREYPDEYGDHNDRIEYITESVDGNEYIIYYGGNEVVLQATRNEPDAREVREMCPPDADWRKMRMVAAYLAMEQDVHDALAELDKE